MRILLAAAAILSMAAQAQNRNVDWKMYGNASFEAPTLCFYDAHGLKPRPDGHLEVWVKCVLQSALDAVDIEKDFDGRILNAAVRLVATQYVPPLAKIILMNGDQAEQVITYEQTADIATPKAVAEFMLELDCQSRMQRHLSAYVESNGQTGSSEKPGEWAHVPPEGNGARLLGILCKV